MRKIETLLFVGLLGAFFSLHADPVVKKTNIGGIGFAWIPAGDFFMGSPEYVGVKDEHPLHKVGLKGFWIGLNEITQTQWEHLMGDNPSYTRGPDRPVEMVSWSNCQEFCRQFKDKYRLSARLPTEAEWEYACRAGSGTKYYWGDVADTNCMVYLQNSFKESRSVGLKRPNRWGLYDLAGNVWEWCGDRYAAGYYRISPARNPKGPFWSDDRVMRGGSYLSSDADLLRAGYRNYHNPSIKSADIGFRIVILP